MENKQAGMTKIAYYSFMAAVAVETLLVLLDKSAYTNPFEGRLFRLTFLLFFIKVLLTQYTGREYGLMGLFLALGAVSYFLTGRNEIIRIVMFLAACKEIDMKKCLKGVFYMTLTGCFLLLFLSLLGIFGTYSITADFGRGYEETRYALGLGHPNALQCMVWALTVLGLYLYAAEMKWFHYLLLLLINGFFYRLTDSKTAFGVAVLTILGAFIFAVCKWKILLHLTAFAAMSVSAAGVAVSVWIAKEADILWNFYTQGVWTERAIFLDKLDHYMTGRIASLIGTTNHAGTIRSWKLFSDADSIQYFDMGWIRLFYWYGIIPAVITLLVLAFFFLWFWRREKWPEMLLLAAFSLYNVMEAHAISVYIARNYVLFIVGMYWWQAAGSSGSGQNAFSVLQFLRTRCFRRSLDQ